MPNILIIWEFGDGIGHLRHLHPFIEPLIEKGHTVTLVTKDIASLSLFDFPKKLNVLPCPDIREPEKKPDVVACVASIWMGRGYSSSEKLKVLVNSWKYIFDLIKPDLIIFDFAPTALLAARDFSTKKVVVGSGFAELVPDKPCRVLSPWVLNVDDIASSHETDVLGVINQCLSDDKDSIRYVGDLYNVDLTLMTTIPELDPLHRNTKNTFYLRPEKSAFELCKVEWATKEKPKVFVYLKAHAKSTKLIMNALSGLDLDVIFCCSGLSERLVGKFHRSNFQVFSHPVNLGPILPSADLVISHASKELVTEAALLGIPQLVLPSQIEQIETSAMIEKLGIGLKLPTVTSLKQTKQLITGLLDEPCYADACRKISGTYDGASKLSSYEYAVERILALI